MRAAFDQAVEAARVRSGPFESHTGDRWGKLVNLRCPHTCAYLTVVFSDGTDWSEHQLPGDPWEHVSVSALQRTPTWAEMSWLKDLFFLDEETVIQLHPPKSRYVNQHEFCLHLWRCSVPLPLPPLECV